MLLPFLYLVNMSAHLSLVHCPICDKSIRGYQVFMNHVLSHPFNNEMEIDIVQGSNNLSEPLPTPSESIQHPRTLLMSPPPSSYEAHLIRGNDGGKTVHTNLKLPPPPPPSYHASSMRGNIYGRDVSINQQLLPSLSSYRSLSLRVNDNKIGVEANHLQQNASTYKKDICASFKFNSYCPKWNPSGVFEGHHIREINFPILDRSDLYQLKFKPQLICDNETSEVDLSLKL